jgi:hypothetical protein
MGQAMKKAGDAAAQWEREMGRVDREMAALGFPEAGPSAFSGVNPPFSEFSNNFRTFRGISMDMYRQPEKLKAAHYFSGKPGDYDFRPGVVKNGELLTFGNPKT